jgi:protein-tyrosine-phosphatase
MTISQKNYIKKNFPKADKLVFTLYEAAGYDPADVADPYCAPLAVYEKCCDEIIGLIENMMNRNLIDNKAV